MNGGVSSSISTGTGGTSVPERVSFDNDEVAESPHREEAGSSDQR